MRYEENDAFKLLTARIDALFDRAEGAPVSSPFLTPADRYFLSRHLEQTGRDGRALFFGGAPGAERQKLFVLPEYIVSLADGSDLYETTLQFLGADAFGDIAVLRVAGGGYRDFSHRDYLGSLLSLGLERDVIGDIALIDAYSAFVFADCRIAGFLCDTDLRVATDRVKVTRVALPANYRIERRFQPIADTVASARLDCVVAALCSLSREGAKDKILAGEVEHCYEVASRPDAAVRAGEIISVRGKGKFEVERVSDPTKKGRFRLLAKKYI